MCRGWSGLFLLPRIRKMKPTYHVGEDPATIEIAACFRWVTETVYVAPYDDFTIQGL
jgi:hypothetical protein